MSSDPIESDSTRGGKFAAGSSKVLIFLSRRVSLRYDDCDLSSYVSKVRVGRGGRRSKVEIFFRFVLVRLAASSRKSVRLSSKNVWLSRE